MRVRLDKEYHETIEYCLLIGLESLREEIDQKKIGTLILLLNRGGRQMQLSVKIPQCVSLILKKRNEKPI